MEIRRLHTAIEAELFFRLMRKVPTGELDNFVSKAIAAALDNGGEQND